MPSRQPRPYCAFCEENVEEPNRNPSPVGLPVPNGLIRVCTGCREKAAKTELAALHRPARQIGEPRPKVQLAIAIEHMYSFAGIQSALEEESDVWACRAILVDRLKLQRVRDAQQYRQLMIDKMIAMPNIGELDALVHQCNKGLFEWNESQVKQQVRQARPVDPAALDDIEPWPHEVGGAAVLDEVVRKLEEFLYLVVRAEYHGTALWIALTHCFEVFTYAAYLVVQSAEKRSAKTRLFDVAQPMAGPSLSATHMNAPTLGRALAKYHMTAFLDEAHLWVKESKDHETLLCSGYQKGKSMWRCVGDDYEPRQFDIYAPKALATIGDLQDTVMDRAIILQMTRKPRGVTVRKWVHGERIEADELRSLCRKLKRWTVDHLEELRNANPQIPQELIDLDNDRAVDIWTPLFAIADAAGGDWPQRARAAAIFLTARASESAPETDGIELLRDIYTLFYPVGSDGTLLTPKEVFPAVRLHNRLTNEEEWRWSAYHSGKPISVNWVCKQLRRYGIRPQQKRLKADRDREARGERAHDSRQRGFWREDFDPVFRTYGLEDSARLASMPPQNRETCETSETGSESAVVSACCEAAFVSRNGETRGAPNVADARHDNLGGDSRQNGNPNVGVVDPDVMADHAAESRRRRREAVR